MEKLLRTQLFLAAQSNKGMPGVPSGSEGARAIPSISMHSKLGEYGQTEVYMHFKRNVILGNVLFRTLWLGCKLWLIRASRRSSISTKAKEGLFGIQVQPTLLLTLLPDEISKGDKDICRILGPTKLTTLEKLLIKASFRFKVYQKKDEPIRTYDVFVAYQAEVISALKADQTPQYIDAMAILKDMHVLLIDLGEFKKIDGISNNLANLATSAYWSGMLYEDWNRVYSNILDEALKRLWRSKHYFNDVVGLFCELYEQTRNSASKEISIGFMRQSVMAWQKLRERWVQEIEVQGRNEHGSANPCELGKPAQNTYTDVVDSFIAWWELLLKSIYPSLKNRPALQWSEFRELGEHFEQHLKYTVLMFMNSVYVGDIFASEWILNTLQQWRSLLSYKLEFDHYAIERPQLLTLDKLSITQEEAIRLLKNRSTGISDTEIAFDKLFAICISNYWYDVICILIYLLSLWVRRTERQSALPVKLIKTLLSGQSNKPKEERPNTPQAFSTATELFQAILRQYFYDGDYRRGYRNRLDLLIESVKRIEKPSMRSGRVYSEYGADDLESTRFGQLFALCVTVKPSWNPALRLESDLREMINSDDRLARNLRELIDSYLNLLEHENFISYENAYGLIFTDQQGHLSFQEARQIVKNGLTNILQLLDSQRRDRIIHSEIDSNRLKEISYMASAVAFDRDKAAFPLNCFPKMTPIGDVLEKRKLVFKMNKGEFTSPSLAQLASNEADFFSEPMKNYVASVVLSMLLKQIKVDSFKAFEENTYWNVLQEHSSRLIQRNLSPILLLDSRLRPEWVSNWYTAIDDKNVTLPKGLNVSRKRRNEEAYFCNLNDIEAYNAPLPIGSSYLIARETFDELFVTDYGGERYVDASVNPKYEDKTIVDLELEFAIMVKTNEYPAIRLKYLPTESSK
jgi:hypothetical protein